jgi:hypothetical protein
VRNWVLVVGLAGCSSSAAPLQGSETIPLRLSEDYELMTTRPRVAVAQIEAEPEVQVEMVDEWPEPPELPPVPTCLPPDAGAQITLDGTALRACWNRGGDFSRPDDVCLWVAADGNAWTDEPPLAPPDDAPVLTVAPDSKSVLLCAPGAACRTLAPVLTGRSLVQQAVIDEEGARVALLLHDGDAGAATVEIYDVATGTLAASGTRSHRRPVAARHEIAFVGPAILWVEEPDEDGAAAQAELWKTKRTKLKPRKKVRGDAGEWATLGQGRFVITDERTRAQVWDAKKARKVASVDADGLGADAESMLITGTRGAFAMLVLGRTAAKVAFVDGWTRRPKPVVVDVPVCQ